MLQPFPPIFVASGTGHSSGLVPDPGGSAGSAKFLREDSTWNLVTDANLSTSDITTNNVSTSKHGFAPKAPNDATKFLDGTGAYSTPASGGSPGGGSGTVQYNNGAGGFAGAPAWFFQTGNYLIGQANGAQIQLKAGNGDSIVNFAAGANIAGSSIGWFGHFTTQQAANQALTDSTGGSASTTLSAVSGTGDDTDINNNFASIAARLAEIRTLLTNYGLGS